MSVTDLLINDAEAKKRKTLIHKRQYTFAREFDRVDSLLLI